MKRLSASYGLDKIIICCTCHVIRFYVHVVYAAWVFICHQDMAGLEGFEPSTAGLRVRCSTWLSHRPVKMNNGL